MFIDDNKTQIIRQTENFIAFNKMSFFIPTGPTIPSDSNFSSVNSTIVETTNLNLKPTIVESVAFADVELNAKQGVINISQVNLPNFGDFAAVVVLNSTINANSVIFTSFLAVPQSSALTIGTNIENGSFILTITNVGVSSLTDDIKIAFMCIN